MCEASPSFVTDFVNQFKTIQNKVAVGLLENFKWNQGRIMKTVISALSVHHHFNYCTSFISDLIMALTERSGNELNYKSVSFGDDKQLQSGIMKLYFEIAFNAPKPWPVEILIWC